MFWEEQHHIFNYSWLAEFKPRAIPCNSNEFLVPTAYNAIPIPRLYSKEIDLQAFNVPGSMILFANNNSNKTGLQPVSRPVEQVHYFGGWVEGTKSLWCQGFADRQPYRTGWGSRCKKVGTKVCKTQQTDRWE